VPCSSFSRTERVRSAASALFSPTSSVVFTVYAPHLIERLLTLMAKLMVAPFRKWYITGNGRRHSRKRRSLPATDNFRFARSGSGPIAGNLSVHSQESQLCHFRTVPYIATLGTVGGYFSGCGCPALSMGFTIVVLDQMSVYTHPSMECVGKIGQFRSLLHDY